MTFEQIWQQLIRKDSRLASESTKIEFESSNLRALLRQVYEQGERQAAKRSETEKPSNPFSDIFGGTR